MHESTGATNISQANYHELFNEYNGDTKTKVTMLLLTNITFVHSLVFKKCYYLYRQVYNIIIAVN